MGLLISINQLNTKQVSSIDIKKLDEFITEVYVNYNNRFNNNLLDEDLLFTRWYILTHMLYWCSKVCVNDLNELVRIEDSFIEKPIKTIYNEFSDWEDSLKHIRAVLFNISSKYYGLEEYQLKYNKDYYVEDDLLDDKNILFNYFLNKRLRFESINVGFVRLGQ